MTGHPLQTVADVVRPHADAPRDRVALRVADSTWTYASCWTSGGVPRGRRRIGMGSGKGGQVAAYGKNSDAYVIGFLLRQGPAWARADSTTT